MIQFNSTNRFASSGFQIIVFILLLGLVAAGGWYTYTAEQVANKSYSSVVTAVEGPPPQMPQNFTQCIAAGNPASQTSPETCTVPGGRTFTQP